jgi:hypothetical protein
MALTYSTNLRPLNHLRDGLAFALRRKLFDLFMREFSPTAESRVADLGVSGHRDHPAHYFFETLYPFRESLTVVARATERAGWFADAFPGITFLEADLRSIPRPDNYFDFALCNAVVEHAGPREEQVALVREVCRVCRAVMFTTPNKTFPVELHTFLPFLHWLPDSRYRAALRALGLTYFADVENLNLLDSRSFMSLFPSTRRNRPLSTGFLGLSSNLICISSVPGQSC